MGYSMVMALSPVIISFNTKVPSRMEHFAGKENYSFQTSIIMKGNSRMICAMEK